MFGMQVTIVFLPDMDVQNVTEKRDLPNPTIWNLQQFGDSFGLGHILQTPTQIRIGSVKMVMFGGQHIIVSLRDVDVHSVI